MKVFQIVFVVLILTGMFVFAVSDAWAGGSISFGINAKTTKVGDGYGHPTYGPGMHNMVVNGSEVYVAYTNWAEHFNYEKEVCVGKSLDGGLTWERNRVVAHGLNIDSNGAAIAIGPDPSNTSKTIHVAWCDYDPVAYVNSIYYKQPYGLPAQNVSGSIIPYGYTRTIAADGIGGVHITFSDIDGVLYYSYSSDYGTTFSEIATTIPSLLERTQGASIAADSDGNVYAAWLGGTTVYFSKRPAGGSWMTTPVGVNGGYAAGFPSIAILDSNRIYIGWKVTAGAYVAVTTNGGGTWAQYQITSSSTNDEPSLAVDSTGVLNFAWESGGSVYFSRSTNGGSRWTAPVVVDDSNASFPNIATDNLGKALIVYGYSNGVVSFTKEK